MEKAELIQKVGETAGKEYQIEKALDEMEEAWSTIDLELLSYKKTGTFVLKGYDELTAVLDEQITMTQAMAFSAFKGPFEERIDIWNGKLAPDVRRARSLDGSAALMALSSTHL